MTAGTGEQLGYRVDRGVKHRWEQWVAAAYGDYQGSKGEAIEDAMRRQIGEDPVIEGINRLADALDVEKVRKIDGVLADGRYAAPKGKNPGDVEARQRTVIDWVLDAVEDGRLPTDDYGPVIHRPVLESAIRDVAGVTTDKTVTKYLKEIVRRSMFRKHPERTGSWVVEP